MSRYHPVEFEFNGQGWALTLDEADSLMDRIREAISRARQIECPTCQRSDGVSAECCGGDLEEKKCPAPGKRCHLCPACGEASP